MKKTSILISLVLSLIAAVAFAASSTATGTGPVLSNRGTAYIKTLSPEGAPTADTPATTISWSWNVDPGMCLPQGVGTPVPCALPSGFRVRLCWHTDADGMFLTNPSSPDVCKIVTATKTGSTSQRSGWLFNAGTKRLRMKLVFDVSGSGALSPHIIGMSDSVTVNW
jgi:hypothetical protein